MKLHRIDLLIDLGIIFFSVTDRLQSLCYYSVVLKLQLKIKLSTFVQVGDYNTMPCTVPPAYLLTNLVWVQLPTLLYMYIHTYILYIHTCLDLQNEAYCAYCMHIISTDIICVPVQLYVQDTSTHVACVSCIVCTNRLVCYSIGEIQQVEDFNNLRMHVFTVFILLNY